MIQIENKFWMENNLDTTVFQNGDVIQEAKTKEEWVLFNENKIHAWCYYENDPLNDILYNWYAVNDPRGLAPVGFHVATHEEWQDLEKVILSTIGFGEFVGDVKARTGGFRGVLGNFYNIGLLFEWWTSSMIGEDTIYVSIEQNELVDRLDHSPQRDGRNVRCVRG